MLDMWLHTKEGGELCVSEKYGFEKLWDLKSEFENIFRKVFKIKKRKNKIAEIKELRKKRRHQKL